MAISKASQLNLTPPTNLIILCAVVAKHSAGTRGKIGMPANVCYFPPALTHTHYNFAAMPES
ncbi:MAG: hypothetical protein HYR56_34640 [Acidobacteria bacterium]|nr:hypothetical protein [Acidobacteriota bacterium]MBI3423609.1 hypothetical protein [Acidobacteriota bacterium]